LAGKMLIRFLGSLTLWKISPSLSSGVRASSVKPPCGNFGEGVAFADGIHYVCPKGIERWNVKHVKKIISHAPSILRGLSGLKSASGRRRYEFPGPNPCRTISLFLTLFCIQRYIYI